ncbi:MAG: glycosyltransferase family 1 protein [Phycisphaeraceae bacterium]|nr:glycosyltransferase family 1 protein [Phycisphaeraceae bacterium]
MRILFVHTAMSDCERQWYQDIASAAPEPISVSCFCLVFPGLRRKLHWEELDVAWRTRHPAMMRTYQQLIEAAAQADVLLLYNGWNLHPEFLKCLPTFNVYSCFDDPDSSRFLSEPAASAFDAVFYGNVASRFQYEAWGCRRLAHLPIFTAPSDVPSPQDRERVLSHVRDNDIVLCCGQSPWRSQRLRKLAGAFAQARCFGKGWQTGFVPEEELLDVYRRSRIGWNVHNTTGPINQRLFALAAWNIFQICDNRTGLAEVFDVGQEVIGFDTIDEAIEATHYYLSHEEERSAIAARAFERYWSQYHAAALWQRIAGQIQAWQSATSRAGHQVRGISELPPPGFLNRLGLIPEKVRPKIQRLRQSWIKRMARDHWPVDEAYYLSVPVPYDVGSRHKYLRYRRASQVSSGSDRALRSQVLCWAATALIRKANSIHVLKSKVAGTFCEYASVDSHRQIRQVDSQRDVTGDLLVGFPSGTKALEESVSRRSLTPRCVLGFDAETVALLGGTDALYGGLSSHFSTVSLFWLPDPVVPWIEPLPGPVAGVSLLVEAQSPQ